LSVTWSTATNLEQVANIQSVLRLTRAKPVEAADIVRQWTAAADRVLFVYWITGVLITIRMFIHDEQVAPTLSRTGNE